MTPYRLLAGIDFSETAVLALEQAAELAVARDGTEFHVACVLDAETATRTQRGGVSLTIEEAVEDLRALALRAITAVRARPDRPGFAPRLFVHVRIGDPVEELVTLGAEVGADLIVLGTHGRRGMQRLWLGSVAERVVRSASCPVLVVRAKREPTVSKAYRPEPPCGNCAARRAATAGKEWWCAQHDHPHEAAHHYGYSSVFDYTAEPYNKVW